MSSSFTLIILTNVENFVNHKYKRVWKSKSLPVME